MTDFGFTVKRELSIEVYIDRSRGFIIADDGGQWIAVDSNLLTTVLADAVLGDGKDWWRGSLVLERLVGR